MSPEKTHPDGWYRLDRDVAGVGRIRVKSGRSLALHRRVDALVTKLAEQGRLEELRALKAKTVTSMMLVDADRRNSTALTPDAQRLQAPLWATATRLFTGPGPTLARYRRSMDGAETAGILPSTATVVDLTGVAWRTVERGWPHSAADWNHLRRALSRFLTLHLGEHHPFRVATLAEVPSRRETERLVELTPAAFQAIIAPAPMPLQHVFWTLAATGLRSMAEYAQLGKSSLGSFAVRVRRSKNSESYRNIPVDPRLWPHVVAAVPPAFKPDLITRKWRALADAAGRPDLVLRDLRHCYGFWSLEAGVPINVVRDAMGHKNLSTTQRYVRQQASRNHAAALAGVLLPAATSTKKRKRA